MDLEELDEWLGPDRGGEQQRSDGGDGSDPGPRQWDRPAPRPADLVTDDTRKGGRSRWVVIGGAAVMLWLTAMLVFLGGRDATQPQPEDGSSLLRDPDLPSAEPVQSLAPTAPGIPVVATPDVAINAAQEGGPASDSTGIGGGAAEFSAILALRQSLLETPGTMDRYLEWAAPVRRTPLAEEIDLVVLDAVWLQGVDGAYDHAERGYWAVPVTLDGVVLAAPWVVGGSSPGPADEPAVPLLRQRTAEVEDALLRAGWSGVVVQASEAHPDLAGTWLGLVDGVDPAGVERAGAVVWLDEDDPMTVLGGES